MVLELFLYLQPYVIVCPQQLQPLRLLRFHDLGMPRTSGLEVQDVLLRMQPLNNVSNTPVRQITEHDACLKDLGTPLDPFAIGSVCERYARPRLTERTLLSVSRSRLSSLVCLQD